jgi:hypothetical protein
MIRTTRYLAVVVLLLGVIGLGIGAAFIVQGIDKNNVITEAMRIEQATYGGNEEIAGVIDTSEEAQLMAETLREHRLDVGLYTQLERDDPRRDTILKAMTMENSLNLAQLGYGVTTVVIVSGVFMIIMGVALGGTGLGLYRLSGRAS